MTPKETYRYQRDCIIRMQSQIKIDSIILSARALRTCRERNIQTVRDLALADLEEIRLDPKLKGLAGENTIKELRQVIYEHGGAK